MPKIKNKQIPPIACLKPPTHPLFIPRYLWSSWLLGIQTSLQPSPCLFCQDSKRRVPLSPCNEAQYGTHTCIFLDRWLLHVPMVKGAQVFQKKKKYHGFPMMKVSITRSQFTLLDSAVIEFSGPTTPKEQNVQQRVNSPLRNGRLYPSLQFSGDCKQPEHPPGTATPASSSPLVLKFFAATVLFYSFYNFLPFLSLFFHIVHRGQVDTQAMISSPYENVANLKH